jgi:hypothetical protein
MSTEPAREHQEAPVVEPPPPAPPPDVPATENDPGDSGTGGQ